MVGDIEPAAALGAREEVLRRAITHSPQPIPAIYTEEPAQTGARRVIVKRPGELGTVVIAHKVPNGRDADQPALEMLDAHLELRQERAAVPRARRPGPGAERRVPARICTATCRCIRVYATLAPGATHEQVEQALLARDRQDQEPTG